MRYQQMYYPARVFGKYINQHALKAQKRIAQGKA